MSDYEVGYGKPPNHSQFKKGVCPNPKGRGKRRAENVADIMTEFLDTKVEVPDRGKIRRLTRRELSIRRLIAEALKGDVRSAAMLLTVRARAEKIADVGAIVVYVENAPGGGTLPTERLGADLLARSQIRIDASLMKA